MRIEVELFSIVSISIMYARWSSFFVTRITINNFRKLGVRDAWTCWVIFYYQLLLHFELERVDGYRPVSVRAEIVLCCAKQDSRLVEEVPRIDGILTISLVCYAFKLSLEQDSRVATDVIVDGHRSHLLVRPCSIKDNSLSSIHFCLPGTNQTFATTPKLFPHELPITDLLGTHYWHYGRVHVLGIWLWLWREGVLVTACRMAFAVFSPCLSGISVDDTSV